MKSRIVPITFFVLSIVWIALTMYAPGGTNKIGALLSVGSGPLGITNPDPAPGLIEIDGYAPYDVSISVDSFGVPHIFGKTEKDVSFGLGYQTAYDRYFQMELMTRMVQGQLSELVGDKGIDMDRFWQKFKIDDQAKQILESYKTNEPGLYASILSYGDGVRAFLEQNQGSNQLFEYNLLGEEPRVWENHYPLLLPYYMSYILTHTDRHLERADVLAKVPKKVIRDLYSYTQADYPLIHPYKDVYSNDTTIYPIDTIAKLFESTEEVILTAPNRTSFMQREMEQSIGSNNWVISPTRSVNGAAVLCNDPHLNLTLPGPWYEVHLVCDSFNTYGFTIPCSPGIISGHNESIAWGITNCGWDMVDRYLLKVDETGTKYYLKDKWVPFETADYTVNVKGGSPITYSISSTVHGFVEEVNGTYYAIKWQGANANHSAITFRELSVAKDIDAFVNALDHFNYPPQNFAYADVQGNIGVISAGAMPIKSNDFDGGFLDGTLKPDNRHEPTSRLPYTFNPPEGFVVSANQQPERTNRYINHSWPEPYRAMRIREILASQEHHSIFSMQRLQGDITDLSVRDFQTVFKKHVNQLENKEFVQQVLDWDGSMRADLHVPLRYEYLKESLMNNFAWMLARAYGVIEYPNFSNMLWYINEHDTLRFGNQVISTQQFLSDVIDTCDNFVHVQLGMENFSEHLYEEKSMFTFNHIMRLPGLGFQMPKDGSSNTPNVNSYGVHASSMRTIIEMGPTVKSWTVLAGGQSGRLHSKQFKNQVQDWDEMKYRESNLSRDPAKHTETVYTITFK